MGCKSYIELNNQLGMHGNMISILICASTSRICQTEIYKLIWVLLRNPCKSQVGKIPMCTQKYYYLISWPDIGYRMHLQYVPYWILKIKLIPGKPEARKEIKFYASPIYAAVNTWPNIIFAVKRLASFTANLIMCHWTEL